MTTMATFVICFSFDVSCQTFKTSIVSGELTQNVRNQKCNVWIYVLSLFFFRQNVNKISEVYHYSCFLYFVYNIIETSISIEKKKSIEYKNTVAALLSRNQSTNTWKVTVLDGQTYVWRKKMRQSKRKVSNVKQY